MQSTVSLIKVKEDVFSAVQRAMELAQWQDFIPEGADVSLKPNLGWDLFLPGAVTSPWVVEGVIKTIKARVGKIYIVEAGQILVDVEKAVRQTKILDLCDKYDVTWVNMSKGRFEKISLPEGFILKEVLLPEILTKTTLITIPVMKTHDKTTITGAIKNQWGCLPEFRHNYHLVVHQVLADINRAIKPKFAVTDATVCLEGNAPKSGRPRILDLVMASSDIVAADSVQARVMGFDPQKIESILNCHRAGLGNYEAEKIELIKEGLPSDETLNYNFKPAKHNFVSQVELFLRERPALRRIVFNPFILKIFCWGAIFWYYFWYYLGQGKKYRDQILNSKYGKQWQS